MKTMQRFVFLIMLLVFCLPVLSSQGIDIQDTKLLSQPAMSGILSRVGMEMMALGVPVVSYGGDYTPYHAKIWDLDSIAEQVIRCWQDITAEGSTVRDDTRAYARENFDRGKEVKKYIKLYRDLIEKKHG